MKCMYCQQEIEPGEPSSYAPETCLQRVHTKCRDDRAEKDRLKRQEAMEKAAVVAQEKWCPFEPTTTVFCTANECMAWDGYDCRRLQVGEVA